MTNFLSTIEVRSLGTADIDKMAAAIDKQSAALEGLRKRATAVSDHPGFEAFAAKVKAGIENPLQGIAGAAESAVNALGPVGVAVSASAGIFAAAGVAMFGAAKSLGAWAVQVHDVELRTGLSAKAVGEFSFAAKAVGQDVTIFERMMRGLTMAIEDQTSKGAAARDWMGKFHVDMAAVRDGSASTSQVITQIADGLNKLPTTWDRNKAALDLFKRGGIEAIPVLLDLAENLKTAKEKGFGFSDADVSKYLEYQKRVAEVEMWWDKVYRKLKEVGMASVMATYTMGSQQWTRGGDVTPPSERSLSKEREARDLVASDVELDAAVRGHVRRLNEALQQARKVEGELEAFEKQMNLKDLGPVSRIFAQRDELIKSGANAGRAGTAARLGATSELAKMVTDDAKQSFDLAQRAGKLARENWDEVYKTLNHVSGIAAKDFEAAVKAATQVADEIDRIKTGEARSEIMAQSGRTLNLANIRMGPGQEGNAILFAYQERIRLANELYNFEIDHAHTLVEQERAEADWRKGVNDAEIEHELKLAELQRKRLDERRAMGAQLFDAALGGATGLEQFALNFIKGQGRIIAGNVFADVTKDISGHFGSNSKYLQGSIFGMDPIKVATALNTTATDLNTRALDDLTALLAAARANALSATGAGGGFSSAGGGFSSAAGTFARIMAGAGFTPASSANWGSGLEVIGSGDSTAGMTQLPSGLWQRGPVGSDAASGAGVGEPNYVPADLIQGGVGFPKNDPNAWMRGGGMTLGKGVGIAGAAVAGGFGIYSGIKAGGAQGDLAAGGSAAAAASSIMMLAGVTGPLAPILMGVGLVLPLISSLFGDPKKNRANEIDTWLLQHQFRMPDPVSIERDTRGRDVSYDMRGNMRPIQVNDNRQYHTNSGNTISAIDSQDVSRFFANNAAAVNKGIARAIDEGGEMVPKLASAMGLQ